LGFDGFDELCEEGLVDLVGGGETEGGQLVLEKAFCCGDFDGCGEGVRVCGFDLGELGKKGGH